MFATYNCYILPAHLSLTLILLSLLNHCKKKKKKKALSSFFLVFSDSPGLQDGKG